MSGCSANNIGVPRFWVQNLKRRNLHVRSKSIRGGFYFFFGSPFKRLLYIVRFIYNENIGHYAQLGQGVSIPRIAPECKILTFKARVR